MEDYKSNSNRSKETPKMPVVRERRAEKVVSGSVVRRKKSGVRKFADVFLPDDKENIKEHIWFDVIIPGVKSAISNVVETVLYGEVRSVSNRRNSSIPRVSYSRYSDEKPTTRYRDHYTPRATFDYEEFVIASRGEAEEILLRMEEMIETYGIASVGDLYDLLGEVAPNTAHKFGWTNLRNARLIHVRNGYCLDLPKALPID